MIGREESRDAGIFERFTLPLFVCCSTCRCRVRDLKHDGGAPKGRTAAVASPVRVGYEMRKFGEHERRQIRVQSKVTCVGDGSKSIADGCSGGRTGMRTG